MNVAAIPVRLPTRVHKFGGTSLLNAERMRRVADLLLAADEARQVTVVSAMKGSTDALIALAGDAGRGDARWRDAWSALRERHLQAARELQLAPADERSLAAGFDELADWLHALALLAQTPPEALDRIQGLGEVWAAQLLQGHLQARGTATALLDARRVIHCEPGELGVRIDWPASRSALVAWQASNGAARIVATGFVARRADGRATTLGRNGSDFSGAIFANLFDADELHIWTDVDGVLSADPRLVPDAVLLPALSYHEACELAYFGAKVVHPQTMAPAMERGIPIIIRNSLRPGVGGTRIDAGGAALAQRPVKGLTLSDGLSLLNVEGTGLIGVPGTAERVFAALRDARASAVMISQGSSEHSICCVVREEETTAARAALEQAFRREREAGQVQGVEVTAGISVLAAVGDGMAGTPGVAARLFGALARARVNVRAIAQGASERNISVAIAADEAARALRAAHAAFWLSPQTLSLGLIGPGKVGAALLAQLREAIPRLRREAGLDLRLRALADSRRMWLDEAGADDIAALQAGDRSGSACDLQAFAAHVRSEHLPHAAILDCSASDAVAAHYPDWLAAGIHVITPNKQAGAGPIERFRAIRAAATASGARFRYEATVGAGLPVIQTLRDLLDTGDELLSIEGIFSGTLAWLFNRYDGSLPFSALVREAHALGYTEPDPRDDLSGVDVARKLVILAREAGQALSLQGIAVESLVPPPLAECPREQFMQQLAALDEPMRLRHAAAVARGQVLRYVARLRFAEEVTAEVGLVEFPADHAFAHLRLTDNVVQFTTRRYASNPLVVQGPGAGPEVTAAGAFADLLRVAASLGARL
jgi:aspartokinase/homoserine dehydrogenase 1